MCRRGCRYQHHRESKNAKQASDRPPRLKHLGLLRSNCERAETILGHPRRVVKEVSVRASRAGALVVGVGERASGAGARFDEHVMAALDEFPRASRGQRDAVLVGLDLFGYAYPQSGKTLARARSASRDQLLGSRGVLIDGRVSCCPDFN